MLKQLSRSPQFNCGLIIFSLGMPNIGFRLPLTRTSRIEPGLEHGSLTWINWSWVHPRNYVASPDQVSGVPFNATQLAGNGGGEREMIMHPGFAFLIHRLLQWTDNSRSDLYGNRFRAKRENQYGENDNHRQR